MNIDKAVKNIIDTLQISEPAMNNSQMDEIHIILRKALTNSTPPPSSWDELLGAVNALKPNLRNALSNESHDLILVIIPISIAIDTKLPFPTID